MLNVFCSPEVVRNLTLPSCSSCSCSMQCLKGTVSIHMRAGAQEEVPATLKPSEAGFGGLLRCIYDEPAKCSAGMCLALSSTTGPFLAYGLRDGNVSVHRVPVALPSDGSGARLPAVFNLKSAGATNTRRHAASSRQQVSITKTLQRVLHLDVISTVNRPKS